ERRGGPRRAGAPPALLALLRGHHLPRGAGAARVGARRARDRSHAYARAAATRLARSRPADRRVDAGRGRIPARGGAPGIRLRPDDDGGGGGRGAGWAPGTSPGASRPSASERQEEGEMSREEMCSMLDGNAAGGLLREVFAFEATAARITCAGCARMMPM